MPSGGNHYMWTKEDVIVGNSCIQIIIMITQLLLFCQEYYTTNMYIELVATYIMA